MNPFRSSRLRLLGAVGALAGALPSLPAQTTSAPAPAPRAGALDPSVALYWSGRYTGRGLVLELRAGENGGLDGSLAFDGLTCAVTTSQADRDRIAGSVQVGADATAFTAIRSGGELRLTIGGTEHMLRRDAPPAAPAVRSPAAVPAPPPSPRENGRLVRASQGFSLRLPAGWTSEETTDGVMLLPAGVRYDPNRNDNPEVYLATLRDDYDPVSEAQVVRQLGAAVIQGGGRGGQREATTFGSRPGASYRWEFRDPRSGRPAALDIHLAIERSQAVVLLAAGQKERVRSRDAALRLMLASISFVAPAPGANGPLADSTPQAQRWLQKLRGKHVRQFWASQGMSSDKTHRLRADGTYTFTSSSMVSVDVPGASALSTGGDNTRGRWRIADLGGRVYLEVRYSNGQVRRMPITEDERNWYLDGEKAFAVEPE